MNDGSIYNAFDCVSACAGACLFVYEVDMYDLVSGFLLYAGIVALWVLLVLLMGYIGRVPKK